jgi:hypothetical protein
MIERLRDVYRYLGIVSISFDKYKVKDFKEYLSRLATARKFIQSVGANVLLDNELLTDPSKFVKMIGTILNYATYVYILSPKKWEFVDILKYRRYFLCLSLLYKGRIFFDEFTAKVLEEKSYTWKTPCHHGRKFININQDGSITGCSFSDDVKFKLNKPKDILKIEAVQFDEFYECPFVWRW